MRRRTPEAWIAAGLLMATLLGSAAGAPPAGATTGAGTRVSTAHLTMPTHRPGHTRRRTTMASGDVPPQNPPQSAAPSPNFTDDGKCAFSALDDSLTCNTEVLKAMDNALSSLEGMAPVSLDLSAFDAMTVPQQLFVITDLERTDRGLTPIAGLTTQLDGVAQTGAADNTDPTLPASTLTGGATVSSWGSLWGGGTSNPLGSDYYWMYDDGTGSPNASCTTPSSAACWGHRDNILGTFTARCGSSAAEQYMGAGDTASGSSFGPSFTEIIVGACGAAPSDVVFTWTQAQQELGTGTPPPPPPPGAPGAPQNVSALTSTKKGVVVSWQAPSDNGGATITGYRVFRGRSAGAESLYVTVTCATTTCTFANTHAWAKRTFFYTVAAVNSVGTGTPSSEVSARAR